MHTKFIYILMIVMPTLLFFSCNRAETIQYKDPGISALETENRALKLQLERIRNDQADEQNAIFEYIAFIDSVESALNILQTDFLLLNIEEPEMRRDRKGILLDRIHYLSQSILADKTRIEHLENQIKKRANNSHETQVLELLEGYRKNRIQFETRIAELQLKVEELNITIQKKDEELEFQSAQIEQQRVMIMKAEEVIQGQFKELDKKFVLLISRSGFMTIEMQTNELIIPKKESRIDLLSPDKNFCQLIKINNTMTHLIIREEFWNGNKILPVFLRGEFNPNV